jgi:hypothetical protein
LLAAIFGIMSGSAQTPAKEEREIEDRVPKHLPIKVKVKKEEKLKDLKNDNWLRDLDVEVTNTGTKPIYFIEISLHLPDALADDERGTAYHLYYGRIELGAFEQHPQPDDVPLMPGKSATFRMPDMDNAVMSWKHFRATGKFRNPKKLYFKFIEINFGDGTGFYGPAGVQIPEKREQSSNRQCWGGDKGDQEVVSSNSPPSYLINLAYFPSTYLSPPVNFMAAAFFAGNPRRKGMSVVPSPTAQR